MPTQHKSRTGKTYYLHVTPGKGGRPRHHFSVDQGGQLADAIPEGYEIYENIGGQVFLRRKVPQVITDAELALVNEALNRHQAKDRFYLAEAKKSAILIYEAEDKTELNTASLSPGLTKPPSGSSVSRMPPTRQSCGLSLMIREQKTVFG